MDNKTKEALKQLQAEVRHLQTLIAAPAGGPPEANGDAPRKEKAEGRSDALVRYAVQPRPAGPDGVTLKAATAEFTAGQLAQVADEAAAAVGYALSSPQKVALLRALLPTGCESAAAVGQATGLTTCSLYHHLRDLAHAGLIRQAARNQYLMTDRGRRALLLVLAVAAEK